MNTFFIETWGCQMNIHDSERLEGQLRAHGMQAAKSAAGADLVLLNTCSVREKPVHKILSRIGELALLPNKPMVGICGCVAQQEGEALLKRSRTVRFVLGPGQIGRVREAVRAVEQGKRVQITGFDAEEDYNFKTIFRKSSTRGMITVIEGCNEYCTFCVVPYTRGRELSRPINDVLSEARTLAGLGVREIELLGQTINAYICPESDASFATLLGRVAEVPGIQRVRFVTSHPRHFGDDLVQAIANTPKISRYLHLPFQSGSNEILKRMNRKYTREEYLALIQRIRDAAPEIHLSTDVIVGFPGESENDFRQTLDIIESIRFGQVFAFAFSPRPNTPARMYAEQVSEDEKKSRLHRLFDISNAISLELNRELVGSTIPVLIDGESRRTSEDWQGRGEDNRVVNFPKSSRERLGDIVDVLITRAGHHSLYGESVDSPSSPQHLPAL
ncbi:MAG: tRNA (N6-isopentenyl adenosine(37)-C2)-methylthiotransferase MiaB [Thermoanaerobaculales bacterium]|nr:tRNA (N6-isopentenyl adenosine(37)-C2)-methylthiotransferase MiaB [Thermoanaerobaculales bacterium]